MWSVPSFNERWVRVVRFKKLFPFLGGFDWCAGLSPWEFSPPEIFSEVKIPGGENYMRRKFQAAKISAVKFSMAKIPSTCLTMAKKVIGYLKF